MKNLATIAMTALTMALLLSFGTTPTLAGSDPAGDKAAAQERKSQRTPAKRNAAAKALKAQLDKDKQAKKAQQGSPPPTRP